MNINVFHLLETVLSDDVVGTMGTRYGLTPEFTRKIVAAAAPALVAAIMQRGATPEGAHSLFSTIMSPEVNPRIGAQLPELLRSTADLGRLEAAGRELVQKATGVDVGALSDAVAAQTGAPTSTAFSLAGVVGAAIMGILKQHFTASEGRVGQLPSLLGQQLPWVNASLTERLASAVGVGSAAAFAGSISGRLNDVSAHLEHPQPVARPVPASVPPQTVGTSTPPIAEDKRRHHWLWWLLAALALIVAFFALRACQRDDPAAQGAAQPASASAMAPAAAASEAAPAPTQDARLSFMVDQSGVPTITATVGTEAEKARLVDALTKQFGQGKFTANVNVDAATKPAEWLVHLDGLLPLMALPGAEVKIDGTHIELSGAAADTRAGWLDKLKSLLGSDFDIGVFNVQKAVADATQSFRDAMKGMFGSGSSCEGADVAKVLNLQVVNFETGRSVVPAPAADDLRESARALVACSQRGKPVALEVAGYSDNVGDKAANLALSQQRAVAVRTFLVSQGVPASTLAAQGYGEASPVDSNDTESGRFHNRRIEFVAKP